jgi:hypothetical protein
MTRYYSTVLHLPLSLTLKSSYIFKFAFAGFDGIFCEGGMETVAYPALGILLTSNLTQPFSDSSISYRLIILCSRVFCE